jgi:hypothetical protein
MRRSNKLQVEEYFRKRIEKRSIKLRFRTVIPESFSFSFFTKSLKLSAEKTIQTTNWSQSRRGIENSLSLQLVASVILIFSTFARQQTVFTGNSTELVIGFSFFKSLSEVSEKGKFDGTSMKFGLSLTS